MNGDLDVTPTVPTPARAHKEKDANAEDHHAACADLRAGDLIANKYVVDRVLGSGGMGLVLSATHVDLKRLVAIKLMRSEFLQNEEIVARMLAEAQMAASIRSEHAARVLDVGRLDSGAPYIVFEYLEGRDLSAFLNELGPLPADIAVQFVLQVCDALAEAHAAGIVHRDLKPENIFLTRRTDGAPIVKVLDFGISKRLSARDRRAALTGPFQAIGSPYYMAPEQMRTGHEVDARADIWALGVVLYELCTGQTPFFADSVPAVCARVLDDNPAPPSTFAETLPKGLERVIMRCLRKDPRRRYQDVAELAAALVHFCPEAARPYAERISRVVVGASSRPDPSTSIELLAKSATQRSVDIGGPAVDFIPVSRAPVVPGPMTPLSLAATMRTRARPLMAKLGPVLVVAGCAAVSMTASLAFFEHGSNSARPHVETHRPTSVALAEALPPKPQEESVDTTDLVEPDELALESQPPVAVAVEEPVLPQLKPSVSRTRSKPKPDLLELGDSSANAGAVPANTARDPWNPDNFGGRQ